MNTYELGVVPIPTNLPVGRRDQADLIYKGEIGKFNAVIDDIAERHAAGQPILVGTISVEKSELLSRMMRQRGIRTRCSTPSSTRVRPRSSPRPAGSVPSPWPPTWPAAASTSSSAATPSCSPARRCSRRATPPS